MNALLEIIHLRSVHRTPAEIRAAILDSLRNDSGSDPEVRLYTHLRVPGDISVHLIHSSPERAERRSHLGLRLAEAFKAYGLVEHSVWADATSGEEACPDDDPHRP